MADLHNFFSAYLLSFLFSFSKLKFSQYIILNQNHPKRTMDESVPDSATAVYWRGILRTSMNAIYNPQALDSTSTLNSVHQLHHLMEAASAEKVKNTNQTTTSTSSNFDSPSKSEHELNVPASFVKNRKNTINSSQKNHSSPKDTCKLFKFPSSS